ncbi:MAG TPA: rod shape-determining protein MreD [Candidatus Limnocylindrales bacterium]|nr:rod shape-determining protein MreD [Candidatus Limnocylindrales bacterium]
MSLLLSAIGATVAAVLDVSLSSRYLTIGNAVPHLVLVVGVIWAIAAGIERGIAWAFMGGLVLDALLGRPLGSSAFALLVAVGGAKLISQPLVRLRLLAPVVAVPILSVVYSVLIVVLSSTGRPGAGLGDPLGAFLPSAIYDGVLGLLLGPLIVSAHDRRLAVERVDW